MVMEDGEALTERWIRENEMKDSAGRLHVASGIWTYKARVYVHVCFDDSRMFGGRAWYFLTNHLQENALRWWKAKRPIKGGTRDGNSAENTGAGYLFNPFEDRIMVERVERLPAGLNLKCELADLAVDLVCDQLRARVKMGEVLKTSGGIDQFAGIDIRAEDRSTGCGRYGEKPITVEVKCRMPWQTQPNLFLQISETNTDGRYR